MCRLAAWPTLAVAIAYGSGLALELTLDSAYPSELAVAKLALFTVLFLALLMRAEGREALEGLRWARVNLVPRRRPDLV